MYDACVLYPAPLRDLLLQLAMSDLFRAHWTKDIHAEWMRNVASDRPDLTPDRLERTRELMDAHVRDCLVEGYERLIPSSTLLSTSAYRRQPTRYEDSNIYCSHH